MICPWSENDERNSHILFVVDVSISGSGPLLFELFMSEYFHHWSHLG